MIPILFDSNESVFTSNGLGRLSDCIYCKVTEERNGIYEVEFQYPITGVHYNEINIGSIISVTHDEQGDRQPFIIYRRSAVINGTVVYNAHHISYQLSNDILAPMTATSTADAFLQFETNSLLSGDGLFSFWTDKTGSGTFNVEVPKSIRAALGGSAGSILDVFGGGEYEFDGYTVNLYQHRGTDNGVTILYGKNLTDITAEIDAGELYSAVVPYWQSEDEVVYGRTVTASGGTVLTAYWTVEDNSIMTDENGANFTFDYIDVIAVPMDLSQEFSEKPTAAELEARAEAILNSREPWVPRENIKVDFVQLWQTEEYKNIAPLERVKLCDTVTVYYPALGVSGKKKVIRVVWNALLDRYDEIELGASRSSFADVIMAQTDEKLADVPSISMMDAAITKATELITGGLGGHIFFMYDADGKPTEMLVMDTEDVDTAVHVLRINVNGIGFSSSGVNGPYASAWTLDGAFVADFITAGHLSCNRIQGGTLSLGGINNGNGVLRVFNAAGTQIGKWDKDGADISGVLTLLGDDILYTVGEKKQVVFYYSSGEPHYKNALEEAMRFEGYDSSNNLMATRNWGYASDSNIFDMTIIPTNTNPVGPQANRIIFFYKGASNINNISFADMVESANSRSSHLMLREETSYNSSTNVVEFRMLDTGTEIFKITKAEAQIGSINAYNDGSSSYGSYMRTTTTDNLIKLYSGQASNSFSQLIIGNKHGTNNFKQIRLELAAGPKIRIDADSQIFITDSSTGGTDTDNSDYMDVHNGYIRIRSRYTSGGTSLYTQIDLSPGQSYQKASTSSIRYKHNIEPLHDDILDPHRLYNLKPKQFRYNLDVPLQYPDMYGNTLPGFIAEDVADVYPAAVIHHPEYPDDIESWDERRIIPPMLSLIQEQHEQIEALTERVNQLEALFNQLINERI